MSDILGMAIKRIKRNMKEKGVNQEKLGELCQYSQAKISNILGQRGKVEFKDIELICEKLEIKLEDIVKEEENAADVQDEIEMQLNNSLSVRDSNFIINPDNMAFRGYLGRYYIYLFPTQSSEDELLEGELELRKDEEEHICRAILKILTGKEFRDGRKIEKVFQGQAIISLPMSSVYCTLISAQMAEMNFLTFRHSFILHEELVCRLATLATVSSGDSRRPTTLRMLISRKAMKSEKEIAFVRAHLLQNQSDIIIDKNKYNELVAKGEISIEFQKAVDVLKNEKMMYVIHESRLRAELNNKIVALEDIAKIRNVSDTLRYNKIGTKADEQVYKYIVNKMREDERKDIQR